MGVTGSVAFQGGETLVLNAAGAAGSGWRQTNGTTFCALNLQPHGSLGATLATVSSWRPGHPSDTTGVYEPFQVYHIGGTVAGTNPSLCTDPRAARQNSAPKQWLKACAR